MKRLLDHNPMTGVTIYHEYDPLTGKTTFETVQDETPFLERNRILRNNPSYSQRGIKNDWWHVASIPVGVQYKWLQDYGVDIYNKHDGPKINRLLDSPDWKYLKCTDGKIGRT